MARWTKDHILYTGTSNLTHDINICVEFSSPKDINQSEHILYHATLYLLKARSDLVPLNGADTCCINVYTKALPPREVPQHVPGYR